jgi:hypothetical protein
MPGFELSGGVEGVHVTRWRIASVEFELHFFGLLRVRLPLIHSSRPSSPGAPIPTTNAILMPLFGLELPVCAPVFYKLNEKVPKSCFITCGRLARVGILYNCVR